MVLEVLEVVLEVAAAQDVLHTTTLERVIFDADGVLHLARGER